MRSWRKIGSSIGGAVDGAILSALRYGFTRTARGEHPSARVMAADASEHDRAALLQTAIDYYERPDVRETFFRSPPPAVPTERVVEKLANGGRMVDWAWPSPFVPHWEAARDEYLRWEANRAVKVRALLHAKPAKTAIICLHGYRGGQWFIEERSFQVRWLYSLGLDVIMFTLPFHGARAGKHAPSWPSPNPVRTNEGFGHAIFDLRALVALLRSRPGAEAQHMAVVGMSLGGYTTSLFATTDKLDFIAPMIPVASWPELLWAHGEGRAERERAEREGISLPMLQRAMSIVSPLERTPLIAPDRVLVLSAAGDRIAPPEHGKRLAAHFGGVYVPMTGGHVLQLGRREAFSAIAQRLALLGLISKR